MFTQPIQVKKGQFYADGKRLKLAGNHTWNTVQPFDGRTTGVDKLTGNFTRLWTVETRGMVPGASSWGSGSSGLVKVSNVPWKKDGSLNKRFYKSLEAVVSKAEKRDMVTGVVLFDHAFNAYFPGGWDNHPFNALGPSGPEYVHTKGKWNTYQRAHVKKVIQTLEPYNNVIYEVGNELHRNSVPWFQRKIVKWAQKFTDKPVGVSYASRVKPSAGRSQSWIAKMGADWTAPSGGERIPGFKGAYVFDTDHASALRPNLSGLKTAWQRGDSLWLMDGMDGYILRNQGSLAPDRAFIDSLAS
jgi:hypothetical protein